MNPTIARLKGRLVVSCQALPDEPLHSPFIMGRMAYAAMLGGAGAIRANTPADIVEIRRQVDLPLIGLYKRIVPGSPVYITPTMAEIDALVDAGADVIALDATDRPRPDGLEIEAFFRAVRQKYPGQLFMADCATFEDGMRAQALGFDLAGTTLAGYTDETRARPLPDFELIERLSGALQVPLIAEGGIWTPEQLARAFTCGAYAAVVGTAITRPREITRRFADALPQPEGVGRP